MKRQAKEIKRILKAPVYPWLERFKKSFHKPNAIIVDLDGTLALLNGRSPYDEINCESDIANPPVVVLIESFLRTECTIIYTSGRQDKAREQTQNWLLKNGLYISDEKTPLFMRKTGDTRSDVVVKQEIFHNSIGPNYCVSFVVDDRVSVVNAWRELGLFVFDANQTREEF